MGWSTFGRCSPRWAVYCLPGTMSPPEPGRPGLLPQKRTQLDPEQWHILVPGEAAHGAARCQRCLSECPGVVGKAWSRADSFLHCVECCLSSQRQTTESLEGLKKHPGMSPQGRLLNPQHRTCSPGTFCLCTIKKLRKQEAATQAISKKSPLKQEATSPTQLLPQSQPCFSPSVIQCHTLVGSGHIFYPRGKGVQKMPTSAPASELEWVCAYESMRPAHVVVMCP